MIKSDKKQQLIVNKAMTGKFAFLVPRIHSQAMELDEKNNNKKSKKAEDTEQNQLLECQTFIDTG